MILESSNRRVLTAVFLAATSVFSCAALAVDFNNAVKDKMSASRDEINRNLSNNPYLRRDAFVRLKSPFNRKQLSSWAHEHGIDVLEAKGSFHYGDQEMVIFAPDLGSFDGSVEEVLEAQKNTYHADLLDDLILDTEDRLSKSSTLKEKKKLKKQLKDLNRSYKKPIDWREVRIIGDYNQLSAMTYDSDVNGVLLDAKNQAEVYDQYWKKSSRQKRPLSDIKKRNKRSQPNAELERSSVNASSDLTTSLDEFVKFIAGTASTLVNAVFPKSWAAGLFCGPGVAGENNCPPDANWLPDYPVWYAYFTEPQAGHIDAVSHISSEWSSTELQAYQNSSLAQCSPLFTGTQARCATLSGPQSDVIYVPDSTFEAEMDIPNPGCAFRTGTPGVDRLNGCFVPYWAATTYPSGYLDTTLFDDASRFSATIGTYNPSALNAGTTYVNYIYFDTFGETISALIAASIADEVAARGQVGTLINSLCGLGIPFCAFGVDTTTVGTSIIVPL